MALPLFKFPILVIKLIFETMGFIDLFVLASTSSKTKRIFRNLVTVKNNELLLFLRKANFSFNYQSTTDPSISGFFHLKPKGDQPDDVFQLKIGSSDYVPSAFYRSVRGTLILVMYWNTSVKNGTKLYNALLEVFKVSIMHIDMDLEDVPFGKYRSWINWNNSLFHDIPCLYIVGRCSFSGYIWILKNVRTKHHLIIRVEPTGYPKDPETIEVLNVEVPKFTIHYGAWISIRQLKAIEAQSIILFKVSITDSEINALLREWRDSEVALSFKELTVSFDGVANLEEVLEGLDVTDEDTMKPDDALNQWSFMLANGEKCTMLYGRYVDDDWNYGFQFHVGH